MTNEITEILLEIKEYVTDNSYLSWTNYERAEALRTEIDELILRLNQGDNKVLEDIYAYFLPTAVFQEHSIQNGWTDVYMKLADQFDKIYKEQH